MFQWGRESERKKFFFICSLVNVCRCVLLTHLWLSDEKCWIINKNSGQKVEWQLPPWTANFWNMVILFFRTSPRHECCGLPISTYWTNWFKLNFVQKKLKVSVQSFFSVNALICQIHKECICSTLNVFR